MRANIKLTPILPIVFVAVTVLFLLGGLDPLDYVMILGTIVILAYFLLGYFRRKDALVIEDSSITIKTPFFHRQYTFSELSDLTLHTKSGKVIKATHDDRQINLINDIYDVPIETIYNYLIEHMDHPE